MRFFKRDWSDPEKWAMGIVATLIVAVSVGVFTWVTNGPEISDEKAENYVALLLGYEAAGALAQFILGNSITQEKALIDGYLVVLGMDDVEYPPNPTVDGFAQRAIDFAQTVTGRLAANSDEISSAFLLGWTGVITLNSPDIQPDFDIREAAIRAGFIAKDDLSDSDYFDWLVELARQR